MINKTHNSSIKDWPEGERPREKLIQFGAQWFTDAELLAILLRIGNEGASAIDIGKRVRRLNANPLTFNSASQITRYCYPKFENQRFEQFLAFLLDGQNYLLGERIISEDISTQSVVYTRKVMEEALRLSASAVVVVHNHLSGKASPSPQDIETTQKLKQAADVLEIIFQDHIIIRRECYYSFMEHGKFLE